MAERAESEAVAKQALKKLEDQLTCAVCLDIFKQPKMLNCFHVFCEHCLRRLVVQDQQGQLSLCCPTCRRSTILPPGDTSVSTLQSAFYVYHLFEIKDALGKMKEPKKIQCEKCKKVSRPATSFCRDCGKFICVACTDIHANWEEFSSHEIVSIDKLQGDVTKHVSPKKVTQSCLKHKDQQLRLYCETCDELICHDCTVRLHKGHQYDLIGDTFEGHKAEIEASLERVEKQMGIANDKFKQVDAQFAKISDQRDLVEASIHREAQMLFDIVKKRELELVSQLDQLVQPKLKSLATQKDEIETILAQLGSCLAFVGDSLKTGTEGEIIKMKKKVVMQIKDMTAEFNADTLTPCEEANVVFVTSLRFAEDCRCMGDVHLQISVVPQNCYATGRGLELATVDEKATACVYALDLHGKPYVRHIDNMTCKLVSEMAVNSKQVTVYGSLNQVKDNQYEISYQPTTGGRHQLHISFDGEHIKGSPFAVAVRRPLEVFKVETPI